MRRLVLHGFALVVVLVCAKAADAQPFTSEDTLHAIDLASRDTGVPAARLRRIVGCETGWTFNPYAVGRLGERGAAQIYPRGNAWPAFFAVYADPFNPYESVYFLADALRGVYPNLGSWSWSCK